MRPQPGKVFTPSAAYWIFVISIAAIVDLVRFGFWPNQLNLGNLVVSVISALCLASVVAGLVPSRSLSNG
jgi:hypothetical protein